MKCERRQHKQQQQHRRRHYRALRPPCSTFKHIFFGCGSLLVFAHKKFFERLLDGLNGDEAASRPAQRSNYAVNIPFIGDLYTRAARSLTDLGAFQRR